MRYCSFYNLYVTIIIKTDGWIWLNQFSCPSNIFMFNHNLSQF